MPKWMRTALYVIFGYAILNFVLFMATTASRSQPKGDAPREVIRGFQGIGWCSTAQPSRRFTPPQSSAIPAWIANARMDTQLGSLRGSVRSVEQRLIRLSLTVTPNQSLEPTAGRCTKKVEG